MLWLIRRVGSSRWRRAILHSNMFGAGADGSRIGDALGPAEEEGRHFRESGNSGGLSVVSYAGGRLMPSPSSGSPRSRGRRRGRGGNAETAGDARRQGPLASRLSPARCSGLKLGSFLRFF